jgi:citrate lyase beta subunit
VLRRSQLYVPGNNAKMITRAPTLGADSIILDLEDTVPKVVVGISRVEVGHRSISAAQLSKKPGASGTRVLEGHKRPAPEEHARTE